MTCTTADLDRNIVRPIHEVFQVTSMAALRRERLIANDSFLAAHPHASQQTFVAVRSVPKAVSHQ